MSIRSGTCWWLADGRPVALSAGRPPAAQSPSPSPSPLPFIMQQQHQQQYSPQGMQMQPMQMQQQHQQVAPMSPVIMTGVALGYPAVRDGRPLSVTETVQQTHKHTHTPNT